MDKKPILCLDFDGVIHSYTSGWKGATVIPDPPVTGALSFLDDAIDDFDVQIYSSRSGQEGGVAAMKEWLYQNLRGEYEHAEARAIFHHISWPVEKPPAMVTIDDRAIQFTGIFPPVKELLAFKTWQQIDKEEEL